MLHLSMTKILGQRIRRAREREGLAQAELADKVGVTQAAIAKWEAGAQPKGVNKSKLEAVLGPLSMNTAGRFYKRVFPDGEGSSDANLRCGVSVLDAA